MCHSKAVREITEEAEETYFLGEIDNKNERAKWTVELEINNVPITLKIDTGADVTVINQSIYKLMKTTTELQPPNSKFVSPGGDLTCMGLFETTTMYKEKQYTCVS